MTARTRMDGNRMMDSERRISHKRQIPELHSSITLPRSPIEIATTMLAKILPIIVAIVASGGNGSNHAATAFTPSRRRHFNPPSKALSARKSTSVYYRDDGVFDATGMERSPKKKEVEKPSDFQSRMKRILVQQQQRPTSSSRRRNNIYHPENIKMVETLEDFATVIEEGRRDDKVVVVRFYATWCKTCHSLRPMFDKTAASNPQTIFLDVPVLETNANLHQGLGVESVPFGHIYHPDKGLVEETKLSRKTFSEFEDLVKKHCS